jgi:zinc/manganese transport system permease protein
MIQFFTVQLCLLAVVLVLHTYIGLHIIRRTLIFSDLALDQLAALGALVGIGLGIEYGTTGSYLTSLVAVLCGALLLAWIRPRHRVVPREAVIGIIYALALVVSLLLGDKLSGGEAIVTKTLAGSLLWVSWPLVVVTSGVYAVLLLFHIRYRRQFIALAEQPDTVHCPGRWDFLLFVTQGIITVLIVPIAGVLLAYAFLMIPAALATLFTRTWLKAVLIGWITGFAACALGLYLSYHLNLPYGPTLVLSLGGVFLAALVVRCIQGTKA